MPTTRKKVIKTVYKDDSDDEQAFKDFSDSGSEAHVTEHSESDEDIESEYSSCNDFEEKSKPRIEKSKQKKKIKFTKEFMRKIHKQTSEENDDIAPTLFSVKDLTDEDKLLPPVLNLSESDSSEDESSKTPTKKDLSSAGYSGHVVNSDSENEASFEYKDVWSNNVQDNSEDVARKTFLELEQHKTNIEQTKASIEKYICKTEEKCDSDVKDLLALGEEVLPEPKNDKKLQKRRKVQAESDSDVDDWEEVKDAKTIPQHGLQLVVDFPDAAYRKPKKVDVEMMMKRRINRVKKEYQVYMHKVHVLCWLAHGNYVSRVLNDQEVMAAALSLVPGKECYPGERVDFKYVEQITTWFKDKFTLNQDKYEDKFRPKAPPLKDILLKQIKSRVVTSKKYLVFIFLSMLRALGLQCRVMFNFVTLPLKPPNSELCSLSTKPKDEKNRSSDKSKSKNTTKSKTKEKISQLDGNYDDYNYESDIDNIMQVDGNDDVHIETRRRKNLKNTIADNDVSPPKRSRKTPNTRNKSNTTSNTSDVSESISPIKGSERNSTKINMGDTKSLDPTKSEMNVVITKEIREQIDKTNKNVLQSKQECDTQVLKSNVETRRRRNVSNITVKDEKGTNQIKKESSRQRSAKLKRNTTGDVNNTSYNENKDCVSSTYFKNDKSISVTSENKLSSVKKKTSTSSSSITDDTKAKIKSVNARSRKSTANTTEERSVYFKSDDNNIKEQTPKNKGHRIQKKKEIDKEDKLRVSHRDLARPKRINKNDVTGVLVNIIKKRVKEARSESKQKIVKGKIKNESDYDEDYLPEEQSKRKSESSDDFKPLKPRPSTSRQIDRRVLSSDDEASRKHKTDVWCEIYVEELEQWISVDVITGKVHCTQSLYKGATSPVCYVVGWDNNNYLKDLTRRYVPHWNTVTRKQRAEPAWWDTAVQLWLGPKTARDREEDESLDKQQLDAPIPKSIAEYKNHPLYALRRHLLKFEAIYPPDAPTYGFVRNEPVYARDCVYTCRSRDVWLKEAKVVRLGEKPYKVVKSRPKWDKLSNKLITDKPLEIFGPWQVQDYEPPVAENGVVPRNAYGNVELFKECMLPKGTVHIKLPGLNKVARKLNIDCAPAMTGFDFNCGWSHPVYDGFVVCKEFEEIVTDAWIKDQEEQQRKEREKIEARVYGNWKKLIKGLFIRERLKAKYGFDEPNTSEDKKKTKGPRFVTKKKV